MAIDESGEQARSESAHEDLHMLQPQVPVARLVAVGYNDWKQGRSGRVSAWRRRWVGEMETTGQDGRR